MLRTTRGPGRIQASALHVIASTLALALLMGGARAFVPPAPAGASHMSRMLLARGACRLRPAGGLRMARVEPEDGIQRRSAAGTGGSVPENTALRMLSSRRFFVQLAAAGGASLALGGGVLAPVKPPAFAADAAADLAGGVKGAPVYDLGIGKDYNRAPGKLIVLPRDALEKSPSDDKEYRALTLPNGLRYAVRAICFHVCLSPHAWSRLHAPFMLLQG